MQQGGTHVTISWLRCSMATLLTALAPGPHTTRSCLALGVTPCLLALFEQVRVQGVLSCG